MKKISAILLVLVMAFSFAACKKSQPAPQPDKTTSETENDAGKKAAEENAEVLKDVEPEAQQMEIPTVSKDKIEDFAKENGADKVTVNKDGSVDVDMSDKEYDTMMDKLGQAVLAELENLRKKYDMIESVQTGLNFDKFYIFVDKAAYEANPDAIDIKDYCESAEVYQILSGKTTAQVKLTLYIMNKDDDLEIARKVYTIKE